MLWVVRRTVGHRIRTEGGRGEEPGHRADGLLRGTAAHQRTGPPDVEHQDATTDLRCGRGRARLVLTLALP